MAPPLKNRFSIRFRLITTILYFVVFNAGLKAQTSWVKDAGNPVLTRDTVIANFPNDLIAISDPWVIKEGELYKMWYTAGGFNYPTDTLLRARICYATSVDGLIWGKYTDNPVLDVSYDGLWDSLGVETATVVYDSNAPDAERYKMWYAGQYFNSYRYDIGYAFSANGINWTKHPSPVLQVGTASEWDNGFLEGPSVIVENGIFKMWYCGYDAIIDGNATDGNTNIGYATSTDGINWTKYTGNPIFTTDAGAWDSHYVQDPHVIFSNGIYEMWYGGNDVEGYGQQVGYATSLDGITWVKSELNPVLTKGSVGDWDASTASFPAVIKGADTYEMWYTGKDVDELIPNQLNYFWELGYASSVFGSTNILNPRNEVAITISPNPVKGIMQIVSSKPLDKATLTIYNQMGQLVLKESQLSGRNVEINIERFSSGIYTIILMNRDLRLTSKFVKGF